MHNLSDTLQPPKFTPFPPGTVESVSPVFGVILSIPPSTSPGRLREMIVRILEEASPMPIVKIYEQFFLPEETFARKLSSKMSTLGNTVVKGFSVRPGWLKKYLQDLPAVLFDIRPIPQQLDACLEECAASMQAITAAGPRYHVIFYPESTSPQSFSTTNTPAYSIILQSLDEASLRSAFKECLQDGLYSNYYREWGKRYRKKMQQRQQQYGTEQSWQAVVRYNYKAAVMEEFLHDYSAAIKSLHVAHLALVDAISKKKALLTESRDLADMIVGRLCRLLVWKESHEEAESKLLAHLNFYHADDDPQSCQWRCKMYIFYADVLEEWHAKYPQSDLLPESICPPAGRHTAPYFYFLAARYASHQLHQFPHHTYPHQAVECALFVGTLTTNLLQRALEWYRKIGATRHSLYIDFLISKAQCLPCLKRADVHNEHLFRNLMRLQRAYRSCGIMEGFREALKLASTLLPPNNPQNQLEMLWEEVSADPLNSHSLDGMEERLRSCLVQLRSAELDMSMTFNRLFFCAVRLKCEFTSPPWILGMKARMVFCNMSPILFGIKSVKLVLTPATGSSVAKVEPILFNLSANVLELIPGTVGEITRLFPAPLGNYTVERLILELVTPEDTSTSPLNLIFPRSALSCREEVLPRPLASILCTGGFSRDEQFLTVSVVPVQPNLQFDVSIVGSAIVGSRLPIQLRMRNLISTSSAPSFSVKTRLSGYSSNGKLCLLLQFSLNIERLCILSQPSGPESSFQWADEEGVIIAPGSDHTVAVYLFCTFAGTYNITFTCTYTHDSSATEQIAEACLAFEPSHHETKSLTLRFQDPFSFDSRIRSIPTRFAVNDENCDLSNSNFKEAEEVTCPPRLLDFNVRVMLEARKEVFSDCSVQIQSWRLYDQNEFEWIPPPLVKERSVIEIFPGDTIFLDFCIKSQPGQASIIRPVFEIVWTLDGLTSRHSFNLPTIAANPTTLHVIADAPTVQQIGQLYPCRWNVWNMTGSSQTVSLTVEQEDLGGRHDGNFIYMGPKHLPLVQIEPWKCYRLSGNIIPIVYGHACVPSLKIGSETLTEEPSWEPHPLILIRP